MKVQRMKRSITSFSSQNIMTKSSHRNIKQNDAGSDWLVCWQRRQMTVLKAWLLWITLELNMSLILLLHIPNGYSWLFEYSSQTRYLYSFFCFGIPIITIDDYFVWWNVWRSNGISDFPLLIGICHIFTTLMHKVFKERLVLCRQ